ncbi:MAG: long-chain fatty acid--CoA ligase [Deltaproteobacteria bacterium]|nr:long-chain fatty acid--CoA ligase [Deltaproteobacteria bacterium]MBW1965069.1 long-chain fatty acid--CoA ligase [Deltaproteobacteria bacterium]
MGFHSDLISCAEAGTLPGLFQQRIERTPETVAYQQYDPAEKQWISYTWQEVHLQYSRWQQALAGENLEAGDRVAIVLRNSVEWVCFEQAALSLGLVVVPLCTWDNPENIAYVLTDSGSRILLVGTNQQWQALAEHCAGLPALELILCLEKEKVTWTQQKIKFSYVTDWLPERPEAPVNRATNPHELATIVYTSGTTGYPKGVMLSHLNIIWNAEAVLKVNPGYREDIFLSFLPLSHTFERTVGYYVPMMAGSSVAYARSSKDLGEDLLIIRPTVLISVPRIFERMYAKIQQQLKKKGALARFLFRWAEEVGWYRFEATQGRGKYANLVKRIIWPILHRLVAAKVLARLGGRLRFAVSGGAPLQERLSRFFIGLGLPLVQGFGLTETAPVISASRLENNVPASVGEPLPGVEIKIERNGELLTRSPGVMLGYWNRPEDTRAAIDNDGWLHTGDIAEVLDHRIFIRGRLKDILVTSTGEKVSPADLETSIVLDPLFNQAMVVGEGRPYIAALLVLNPVAWQVFASGLDLDPEDPSSLQLPAAIKEVIKKIVGLLRKFPAHAQVRSVYMTLEPWTIENGMITATMKLKRLEIERQFAEQIRKLYVRGDIPA